MLVLASWEEQGRGGACGVGGEATHGRDSRGMDTREAMEFGSLYGLIS